MSGKTEPFWSDVKTITRKTYTPPPPPSPHTKKTKKNSVLREYDQWYDVWGFFCWYFRFFCMLGAYWFSNTWWVCEHFVFYGLLNYSQPSLQRLCLYPNNLTLSWIFVVMNSNSSKDVHLSKYYWLCKECCCYKECQYSFHCIWLILKRSSVNLSYNLMVKTLVRQTKSFQACLNLLYTHRFGNDSHRFWILMCE